MDDYHSYAMQKAGFVSLIQWDYLGVAEKGIKNTDSLYRITQLPEI